MFVTFDMHSVLCHEDHVNVHVGFTTYKNTSESGVDNEARTWL